MWKAVRRALKYVLDVTSLVLVSPAAATVLLDARLVAHGEGAFSFWAHTFALAPGLPGVFLRRAYYRLTLDKCAARFFVGFGAFFSHRQAVIEEDVYIGAYAIVGSSVLRKGCMIGSRSSVISGSRLHVLDSDGRWTASDLRRLQQIEISEYALIGEACVVMADVGRAALVAAGAVVSGPVAPGVVVAGNPARFVRSLEGAAETARGGGSRQMLDWMKAVGMCLIVYGHVAAATTIPLTPPVYLKQFGVAFFLFATAFTLARETRPAARVLCNRLFRVYLFGVALAVLITLGTGWTTGGLALSNYLPFLGGANVVFDNFPVNPTTRYVGTYLHFLILWVVVLRHVHVRAWMVVVALLAEIPIRMALITIGGRFVAYMVLTTAASLLTS